MGGVMPTAQEIALIAEQRERVMDRTAMIRREDFIGEDSFEPVTKYENVPYGRNPGFGFYRDIADRFSSINAYTLKFPVGTDVRLKDTVVDEADSQVFVVRDTRPQSFETARVVLADRIG